VSAAAAYGKGRLQSLDTLRGVAIVMVVAFHVTVMFRPAPWLAGIAQLGNSGVQLFFLISAITMCFMWQQREGEPDARVRFYVRRFFRIAPLFWAAICFYLWWSGFKGAETAAIAWDNVALSALFLHGFSPAAINAIVPGGWSIAVEMSFYAVFPLLVMRRWSPGQTLWFALLSYLVLGVAATAVLERSLNPDPSFMYYSLLTQFPIFPIGMFVYAVAMRGEPVAWRNVVLIALGWLAVAFVGKYVLGLNTRPFFWLQVALFAVMVGFVVRRGIRVPGLSLAGTLSYSMYLFHFAIIDLLAMSVPPGWRVGTMACVISFMLVLVVTMAAAKMSGVTLERWSSDAARALIERTSRPKAIRLSSD
jgi:peptidoglycan/LPS O-acetylase OafA/YrhL